MCQGNPVLRVLGFSFLLVAFITAGIGFISPFWIRNTKADPEGMSLKETFMSAVGGLTLKPSSHEEEELIIPTSTATRKTTTNPIWSDVEEDEEEGNQDLESRFRRQAPNLSEAGNQLLGIVTSQWTQVSADDISTPSDEDNVWFWEGLWAKCQSNLTCRCFIQNDFEMEKDFHDWHKAAQGLFSLGFIVYFITILIAGFYLCCTCCKESVKLATTLGSFTLTGILLIALALIVYGGFSYLDRKIHFEGSDIVFEWGYFLAIASLGPAVLAAIFYFIDGCRGTIVVEHDDCETAKMV